MTPKAKPPLILIVDDDPAGLLLAMESLQGDGFAVEGARSADDARSRIARRKPNLILMDIRLPGMDGLEFTKELKSKSATAAISVIALTAHAMPLSRRRS